MPSILKVVVWLEGGGGVRFEITATRGDCVIALAIAGREYAGRDAVSHTMSSVQSQSVVHHRFREKVNKIHLKYVASFKDPHRIRILIFIYFI